MSDKTAVIYAARNMQEAHLLKDALAEAGIRQTVINDMLEGGSGVDIVGWPTLARVVVAEEDAQRAREMALEFERRAADMGREGLPAQQNAPEQGRPEEKPREPVEWPTCPRCGQRRRRAARSAGRWAAISRPPIRITSACRALR